MHRILRFSLAAAFVAAALISSARAADAPPRPKLFAFCIDTHDAKKRSLPEQAQMVRELGFEGVGYPLWLGDQLDKNLKLFDEAKAPLAMTWFTVNVKPGAQPFDPGALETIAKLKGRPVVLCVLLQGLPPGDPRGEPQAVAALRRLGDAAAAAGLRVSIYHHTGDWTQSLAQALAVVEKADHAAVGVNFNLCHWLMIDGDKDYRPVLRANAGKIFVVTINGAKLGSKTWTNGLILPLDQGDFDNRALLATLREIDYRGPIGLMCYGIPGDVREHLERSLKAWRSW